MSDWIDGTIGDLIQLSRGIDLPEQQRRPGSVPIMGSFGVTGYHDRAARSGPGVTVGRSGGSIGVVSYTTEDYWPLNTALYVKDFKGNDPRFCYYFLKTFDLARLNSGSAQPSLNRNFVHPVQTRFPRHDIQIKIAALLGALDDKIDLNRRMNWTLEAMVRAIFKDWFVDFGPTRAKMAGRAPYLAPEVWALFPDLLDGGNPEGWPLSSVGKEFQLTMGQSPPGDTYNEDGDGLPFFQGRTDFGFRYPTNRKFCSSPTRLADTDDTLVSVRAPVGDLNMARERCCIGRGVSAARHRSAARGYTYYALQSIQPALEAFEHTGTVFGAINKAQFEGLEIIAPAPNVIEAFEAKARPLDDRIRLNTQEAETLADMRDLLLPRLMSGEIRLRDAEAMVADAA